MKKLIFLLTWNLALAAGAQVYFTNAPRTYYDSFNATKDALLIKGSSVIGALNSQIDYPVEIRAEQLSNPSSSNTIYAVSVRTTVAQQLQVDYVDYDELDPMIRSLQYISQANNSITAMDNFEAVFRTRSGLSVAKVGRGNKVTIAMTSGCCTNAPRNQMAAFVLDDLGKYLTAAKAKIDLVIANGQ